MNHENALAVVDQAVQIATAKAEGIKKQTTVTVTSNSIVAVNHSGSTGVCIAVSTAVQVAARMLNEAECVEEIEIDPSVPLFRVKVKQDVPYSRKTFARATFQGMLTVLREIQQMNPNLLYLVERE